MNAEVELPDGRFVTQDLPEPDDCIFCDTCGDCLLCGPHGEEEWCSTGGIWVVYLEDPLNPYCNRPLEF